MAGEGGDCGGGGAPGAVMKLREKCFWVCLVRKRGRSEVKEAGLKDL